MAKRRDVKDDIRVICRCDSEHLSQTISSKLKDLDFQTTSCLDNDWVSSHQAKHSFYNTFVLGMPSSVLWKVEKHQRNEACICFSYFMPKWLKIQFCLYLFSLMWVFYVSGRVFFFLTLCPIFGPIPVVFFFATIVLLLMAILLLMINFAILLARYQRWSTAVLETALKEEAGNIWRACLITTSRSDRTLIDKGMFGISMFSLILVFTLSLYDCVDIPDIFTYIYDNKLALLAVAGILLLILWLLHVIRKRDYVRTKLGMLSNNFAMCIYTTFLFFLAPLNASLYSCEAFYDSFPSIERGIEFSRNSEDTQLVEVASPFYLDELNNIVTIGVSSCITPVVLFAGIIGIIIVQSTSMEDVHRAFWEHKTSLRNYLSSSKQQFDASEIRRHSSLTPFETMFLVIIMAVMSGLCWVGLMQNLSLAAGVLFPNNEFIRWGVAEKFLSQIQLYAGAFALKLDTPWLVSPLRILLAWPALIPLLGIFLFNASVMLLSSKKRNKQQLVRDEEILSIVKDVSQKIGIDGVKCVLDTGSDSISPRAEIKGFTPERRIIFYPSALEFCKRYPDLGGPIIAHEMTHLLKHCSRFRWYRILSRLSLLGLGSFSVFIDPVKCEKEADRGAFEALRDLGKDPMALGFAVASIDETIRLKSTEEIVSNNAIAAFSESMPPMSIGQKNKASCMGKIRNAFHTVYMYYFVADAYDYIHLSTQKRLDYIKAWCNELTPQQFTK